MAAMNGKTINFKKTDTRKISNIVSCLEVIGNEMMRLGYGESAFFVGVAHLSLRDNLKDSDCKPSPVKKDLVHYMIDSED